MSKQELAKPMKMDDCKYDEYCVKNALRTLKEAEEIKRDPKMMKLLSPLMDGELRSLEDLKAKIQRKGKEDNDKMLGKSEE